MKCVPIISAIILVSTQLLKGQTPVANNSAQVYQPLIKDVSSLQLNRDNFFEIMSASIGLTAAMQMNPTKVRKDPSGMIHITYEQRYQGKKMYGTRFLLHEKDHKIKQYSGTILPTPECSAIPTITQEWAKQIAQHAFFNSDQAQVQSKTQYLSNSQKVKIEQTELVWVDKIFPLASNSTTLAWRFVIESSNPLKKREILLDAHDGYIIYSQSKIFSHTVPSLGETHFYEVKSFNSDSLSPGNFELRDIERNITTYTEESMELQVVTNSSSIWNLKNAYYDEVAIDAHYCTSNFYDMMFNKLNWKGIDDEGGAMNPVVQMDGGLPVINAFWDGRYAFFGNGNCHMNPFTTLSIVGHEFMHGIIQNTANLDYTGEPGALNEAYCDIFGKANEYYNDPNHFSWLLDSIIARKYGTYFRSMKDPNSLKMPKCYKGLFWNDFAEVHMNSSVLNHWFYLMVAGGSGVSEKGLSYQVNPQPMDKVLNILFSVLADYLTPISGYHDCFEISKVVCENLYGNNSSTYVSLLEAWKAVGITTVSNPNPISDLALYITPKYGTKYCYTQGTYQFNYQIVNLGNVTIPAGTQLGIEMNIWGPKLDTQFVLSNDLTPGNLISKTFTINISQTPPDYYSFYVQLQYYDDKSTNNYNFSTLEIQNYSIDNVQLANASIKKLNCTGPDYEVTYYVLNNGCNEIPKGSIIKYNAEVNNVKLISSEAVVDIDDMKYSYFIIVDTFTLQENNAKIHLTIQYGNDTKPMDNFFDVSNGIGVYDQLFNLNFSNEDYLDIFNEKSLGIVSAGNIIKLNNEYYHINIGSYYLPDSSKYLPCPVLEDNFFRTINNIPVRPLDQLSTCLDLSAWNATRLSLDVIQYRADDSQYNELFLLSSLLRISWMENQQPKYQFILGQNEGEKINYQIHLPNNYVGPLELEFYNRSRENLGELPNEITQNDVILIDNLKVDELLENQEPNMHAEFLLLPNPVYNEIVLMVQSQKIYEAFIQDIQGKFIQHLGRVQEYKRIPVEFLSQGIYQIIFIDQSGNQSAIRFVKM